MNELRWNPLAGQWVTIATERAARVRGLLGDVPYNLVLHTAPRGHEGPYHWHVHVVPRVTSVAGFEQGTGALINIVAPELAAQQLVRQDPGGD